MAAAIAAIILATVGLTAIPTPAWAAPRPVGDCTTTSGVILAVDFGHWGGPLLRSCGSTPTTGYALLNQGGWHTTGTQHDGPGFICRIGYDGYRDGTQYPTPQQDPCVLTPPVSAYWTYWHADPGQNTWSYSQLGAMSEDPEPGSVALWVFGGTNIGGTAGSAVPAITPDSVRALNASPAGAVRKPAATHAGATPAQDSRPATARATPSGTRPAGAAAAHSGQPTILDAPPTTASAAHVSHGSATPAIITLVIVLLLAAAGITAAARRPRREH